MSLKTTGYSAAGTTLSRKASGSETFSQVTQLISMSGPNTAIADIDTTLLASTAKTFVPSIPDNGEVTFQVFSVPGDAVYVVLQGLSQNPEVDSWEITLPDGTTAGSTVTFSGYIKTFGQSGYAIDDKPVSDLTLKVTGLVTLTLGS